MKKYMARIGALLLAAVVLCGLGMTGLADTPAAAAEISPLTILFTHDTHDHFYPDAADVGGFTRLATLLDRERAAATGPVVTLDAGDFSMGSPFQTVYSTDAPELRALGAMGYDVTTFGNHEYDYRPQGLADMLRAAKASGERLPVIVQANYKTPKNSSAQVAVDAMRDFPVNDYVVLEREGTGRYEGRPLTIAVFGLVGIDSDECTPMSGMALEDPIEAARRVVADIQANVDPDYIVCLSHSGTEDGKGEDYELAKAVDGIDVIISGHTHTTLPEPIVVNNTYICSCGPYTRNLGVITVSKSGSGTVTASEYRLIPIDSTIQADRSMVERCEGYKLLVDQNYLANYGFSYDQVLNTSGVDFTIPQIGDFIGESYIETVKTVEGSDYVPIAFAVTPDGVIRDVIRTGEITTADAFNILSLGVGADGTPGYPLISLYLTGKDLKNAFEVDASVSQIMPSAALFGAGSSWKYNPNRMFLDRLTYCTLSYDDKTAPIQDDQLYRVVADLYSGQMLSAVKAKSFGILSVTPRDASGNEILDFEDCIIHDRNGQEVKAWYALAAYLDTGVNVTPPPSSKTVAPSWNPLNLLIPMGLPTLVVVLVGLLVLALIIFIIYRIATRKKHKARKAAKKAAKKARKEEKAAARERTS